MEEDHYSRHARKEHSLRVVVGIAAVLGVGLLVVLRYGCKDRYVDPVAEATVRRALANPQPPPDTTSRLPLASEPIEFELVHAGKPFDVIPGRPLELGPDLLLALEPAAAWRVAGDGFYFEHAPAVSVLPGKDSVIAAADGSMLQIHTIDPAVGDAEAKQLLASKQLTASQTIGEPRPVTRTIAGKPRIGVLHDTATGMTVEAYLVGLDPAKRLGVLLYIRDPSARLARLDDLLASIHTGSAEPTPHFTVAGDRPTPLVLDRTTEVALDRPGAPPVTVMLRRRATVVRTLTDHGTSLTLEHPHGFSVTTVPNPAMLAIAIQNQQVTLQLFALPISIGLDDLQRSLLGTLRLKDLGEVTRGPALRGRKLLMESAGVVAETYVIDRGGKSLGVMIQYLAEHEAAVAQAVEILATVQ